MNDATETRGQPCCHNEVTEQTRLAFLMAAWRLGVLDGARNTPADCAVRLRRRVCKPNANPGAAGRDLTTTGAEVR